MTLPARLTPVESWGSERISLNGRLFRQRRGRLAVMLALMRGTRVPRVGSQHGACESDKERETQWETLSPKGRSWKREGR